jgi:hypothetical protein
VSRLEELVASLRGGQPFEVEGRPLTTPDRPLLDWFAAIAEPADDTIVPGLLGPEDAEFLYDRLLDDEEPLDSEVCREAGEWVLEQVGGRPWWEVHRIVYSAVGMWNPLDAWSLQQGVRLLDLTLRSFCNLVVRFVVTVTDKDAAGAWMDYVTQVPPSVQLDDRPEWSDEAMGSTFLAVMAQQGAAPA